MDLVDNQESKHHKHHKHSKHSKHSHSKSKHKHRKHHHHHHKKSHGKHHRHRSKLRIDEQALQSALESLEDDALDSIRMEVNKDLHSEAVELLVGGSGPGEEKEVGGGVGGSEDSDSSSSESDPEGELMLAKSEERIVNCDPSTDKESTTPAVSAETHSSGSIPLARELESILSASLNPETLSEDYSDDGLQSESENRDSESEEEEKVSSREVFSNLKLKKKNVKMIQINIQRKSLVSDAKEADIRSDLSSPKEGDGGTVTVTTGDAKVTYVNLKSKKMIEGPISDSQFGKEDGVPFQDDEKSRSDLEGEFSSASEERERVRERRKSREHSSRKRHHRSRSSSRSSSHHRHRHGRSRSRSPSRSPERSYRQGRSRHNSRSRHRYGRSSSHSRYGSRSTSPQRSHRHRRARSRSQSRSPQRSHRHRRARSRSRSRSPQRSHRHSRRSRSRSRSRSPQRSHRHSRRSRSRSRSRSPQRSHRKGRSRSRSRSRSPERSHRHGRSRSRSRRRNSRDCYSGYHSRKGYSHYSSPRRYHSPRRSSRRSYHRSRSRSSSRHRRKYHSRTRSYSRGSSRSRSGNSSSRSRSPSSRDRDNGSAAAASSSAAPGTGAIGASVSGAGASDPKQAHIAQLTALCKHLQEKQATEDNIPEEELQAMEERGETEEVQIRAPFNVAPTPVYQTGLIFHNNVWKTPNQLVAESNAATESRPVEAQFPVSTGLDHQITEGAADAQTAAQSINVFARFESVSVGDLVVKRLEATRKLQENPSDFTAQQTLAYIEQKAKVWAESHMKPGQFTGQRALTALTRQDHKMGMQAWAKKKMFHGLAPVMSSFGMKMLKKMGWQEGQPLGRMGEGHVEPIAVDVKVDRSGLTTQMDKQPQVVLPAALQSTNSRSSHLVHGKHPVSVLQEICAKKHWDPPHYELLEMGGPAHKKSFLYKITVPLGTFQPAVASPSKKQAKAQAATACLQGLGFSIDSPVTYTAS